MSPSVSAPSLLDKILFIQNSLDPELRLILDASWASTNSDYRLKIRQCLSEKFSSVFSRAQLALLNDLNSIPAASEGCFSISHCRALGGFAYSKFKIGFDVEETKRISLDILQRTCSHEELANCPRIEFLWVAKEAAFKAHHRPELSDLVITDLICTEWESHFENQVFCFRLKSQKTLDFSLNKGFIFSENDCLYAIYFH